MNSTRESRDGLVTLLQEALSPDIYSAIRSCVLTGPIYNGSHSMIFRGDGSLFPFPVAVKQIRERINATRSVVEDARIQFSALERVSTAFMGQTEMAVPRPIALIEGEGIVVSEWVDGLPLTRILHYPASAVADVEYAVMAVGRWLAAFHAGQQASARPLDTQSARVLVDKALDEAPPQFRARFSVSRPRALLESTAQRVSTIDVPFSWTHGDFKPGNILICANRTVGIDIGANSTNAILFDIAHFLNDLEIALYHPKALRMLPHRHRLVMAFRASYGGLDEIALAETWLRLLSALRLRAELWTSGSGARRIYNDICLASLIRHLARTLRQRVAS